MSKVFPQIDSVRKWRPSLGHVYHLPNSQTQARQSKSQESKEETPVPDAVGKSSPTNAKNDDISMDRVVEEAFMVHMRYGGEYIDENPITGRPGDFHLSSTGRKPVPPPQLGQQAGIGAMNGPTINTKVGDDKKDGKDKTPKSAISPKLKRRKSKKGSAATTPAGATPA